MKNPLLDLGISREKGRHFLDSKLNGEATVEPVGWKNFPRGHSPPETWVRSQESSNRRVRRWNESLLTDKLDVRPLIAETRE